MDESAEQIAASRRCGCRGGVCSGRGRGDRVGRLQVERAVRAVLVVVADVDAEDALELAAAEDEEPVEALAACGSHPALDVRGIEGFAKGLKVRKQALELARQELAKIRPSGTAKGKRGGKLISFDEFIVEHERDLNARFIDKVWLKPAGRVGSRVPPVEERVEVFWVGASEPARPPAWSSPEIAAALGVDAGR